MDFTPNKAAIVKRGNNGAGKLPPVQNLNPKLAALANSYFGIDLQNLDSMSDEQLAAYADMARDSERWLEIIPILEQHFQKIMQAQLAREQFYAAVQKAATNAGKQIDKAILQTFLAAKGYDLHLRQMSQKAHNGAARLDADHRAAVSLELKDFQSYLQLVQWRHQRQEKAIAQRLPQAQSHAELAEAQAEQKAYRKNLLTQGTEAANRNRQQRRGFGGVWDWFNGKD
jgi:hypothetical protein